jgi:cytochrome c peroxidase
VRSNAYIIFLFALTLLQSCKVDPNVSIPVVEDDLKIVQPEGWPAPVYTFSNNAVKKEVFELGRELFYDPILSHDNTVACGSCHQQYAAFANIDHKFSHGIHDQLGNRNAPGIFNITWHKSFMHDGGIGHIEIQPLGPIQNPIEMGDTFAHVIKKLEASEKYRSLFKKAYGTEEVTDSRVLRSMAQFMGLMYSYNSKFDLYKRNEKNTTLSDQEMRGYNLFNSKKCATCHTEPLFSDFNYHNNAISVNPLINDSGRCKVTHMVNDAFYFKTPSLRNVALTGPYMHDGRYSTLYQCVNHYSHLENRVNLDPLMPLWGMALTEQDKSDIIAFLNTLTDYQFINDQRFADPNQR